MRDIDKAIARGDALLENRKRLALNVSEIYEIVKRSRYKDEVTGLEKLDSVELIYAAFRIGLGIGYNAALRDMKTSK